MRQSSDEQLGATLAKRLLMQYRSTGRCGRDGKRRQGHRGRKIASQQSRPNRLLIRLFSNVVKNGACALSKCSRNPLFKRRRMLAVKQQGQFCPPGLHLGV